MKYRLLRKHYALLMIVALGYFYVFSTGMAVWFCWHELYGAVGNDWNLATFRAYFHCGFNVMAFHSIPLPFVMGLLLWGWWRAPTTQPAESLGQ